MRSITFNAVPLSDTIDYLTGKAPIPSELRSADWDRAPLWVRERSFFMAAVDEAEILQLFQDEATKIAAGESTNDESKRRLRAALDARGYRPTPGQEGTIKDLRSLRRMDVVLDTNVEMARGYGEWLTAQETLASFPAWRYVRGRQAMVPRDWPAMWNSARSVTFPDGASEARPGDETSMAALVNHPLWTEPGFNRFGAPYPPFQFGSGMTVTPMSRTDAKAEGLLPDRDTDPEGFAATRALLRPQSRSLNESLEARPAVTSPALKKALGDRLRGYAEWVEDRNARRDEASASVERAAEAVLRFTDPNGTRPGTPAEIAEIITRPLPIDPATGEPFPRHQLEALRNFAEDPEAFVKPAGRYRNQWNDLGRLIRRTADGDTTDRFLRLLADEGDLAADDTGGLLGELLGLRIIPRLLESDAWREALAATGVVDQVRLLITGILAVI